VHQLRVDQDPVVIPRDRHGKPLIAKPGTGAPIYEGSKKNVKAYFRASKFGEVLEDQTNLTLWKIRMAMHGLAKRPDLYEQVQRTPLTDKVILNRIAEDAIEAAGGAAAANVGTALHTLTEAIDRGEQVGVVPPAYAADLDAYVEQTRRFKMLHIERFMVCDELQVAGTPDRLHIGKYSDSPEWYGEPQLQVGDLKTSNSNISYQGMKFAIQLGIYAHSDFYNPQSGERTSPGVVDQDVAVVYHMPSGGGTCELIEVDVRAGWEMALLARQVRQARNQGRRLLTKVEDRKEAA
jgi:hypothetical protein